MFNKISIAEDKLSRKGFVNDLFTLFEHFGNQISNKTEKGLTIAIDGKFGSGKSTLLGFIEEQNAIENKFDVVTYNAWEDNFFENPLIPILAKLNEIKSGGKKFFDSAIDILKKIPKILTGTLSNAHSIDLTALTETDENIFTEYKNYKKAIIEYQKLLKGLCSKKKVILMVDELDRCLPEYQIKVLETLYNIFNIPNLILVIAIDKSQLEYSIKNIFGNSQNVTGYLSKFIDYEIDLPVPDNYYLIDLMQFECNNSEIMQNYMEMLKIANLSTRESLQVIQELNLICNKCDENGEKLKYHWSYPGVALFVLIVKKIDRELYKKYFTEPLKNIYDNNRIPLSKTQYGKFYQEVKNTRIGDILSYWLGKEVNFSFIYHIMNLFVYLGTVELSSIAEYATLLPAEEIQRMIYGLSSSNLLKPKGRDDLLEKIKFIKF